MTVIYMFNIVLQNMKQPDMYKIKDGLHELGVKGKNRVIRGQIVCKESLVDKRK